MKLGRGFPKFKRKFNRESFTNPQHCGVDFENGLLSIPKIPNIEIILDRTFKGDIKRVTIKKTPTGKYYASILVDNHQELPPKPKIEPRTSIGIDLGLKHFLITSNGEMIPNPKFLKQSLNRLKLLQHRASNKTKGSSNRRKANFNVAKQYEYVTNQRTDFLQKLSTQLIRENQTICVEDLSVKNMIKNHKLAQSISDVSWSSFTRMLKYKSEWYGRNFIQIGTFFPSSKTCSECGHVLKELDLSIREWTCPECETYHDRDINASRNIKREGIRLLLNEPGINSSTGEGIPREPVEMCPIGRSVKQEKYRVQTHTSLPDIFIYK